MRELPCFDELVEMAKNEPESLEKLLHEMSDDLIAGAPQRMQRRLRGLQFEIDAQRKISASPAAAMVKIHSMMMDSVDSLRSAMNQTIAQPQQRHLQSVDQDDREAMTPPTATILSFEAVRREGQLLEMQ